MTFHCGKTALRIHPLLPICWGIALLPGGPDLIPGFLALMLHEAGHITAARLLHIGIDEIEITPLGGLMTLHDAEATSAFPAFLLAAAGPVCSGIGCMAAPVLLRAELIGYSFAQAFARANLLLLVLNLLPALPLDGGCMVKAVLSPILPAGKLSRVLTGVSFVLGAALCSLTLLFACRGQWILAPAFAGTYLLYASAIEGQKGTARYVTALIGRRQQLEERGVLPVEMVAASGGMTAAALLRWLHPGKYHVISVLSSDGMQVLGHLDEQHFCAFLLKNAQGTLLEAIQNGGPVSPGPPYL